MRVLLTVATLALSAPAFASQPIAYWAQNDNELVDGGNGFTPASFPMPADVGEGSLYLNNFNDDVQDGAYRFIQSFSGSTSNALPGFGSGGSLSPQGGAGNSNNGMSVVMEVDTSELQDIHVSWAQRGTATGFDSREFAWSVDGSNYTVVETDTGALGSSWSVENYDLSAVTALNDQPNVYFRITLDGASSQNGNNRFDNLLVSATNAADADRITVYDNDFSSDPFNQGWYEVNVSGNERWQWDGDFDNISLAPYVGGQCQSNENWLISPRFDFSRQFDERLALDIARGFPGDNPLEIYYSESYDGEDEIDPEQWQLLTVIDSDDFNQNNVPQRFDGFEQLQDIEGYGYIAVRFSYQDGDCGTWRVSGIELTADVELNTPDEFACGAPATPIHYVQGEGFQSPLQNAFVHLEGVVTGSFQSTEDGGLGGFFLQTADAEQDNNPLTSEGIFIHDDNFGRSVYRGDIVRVAGVVSEQFSETQLGTISDVELCASNHLDQVSPALVELPVIDSIEFEALEGMWVETAQELVVTDVYNAVRFGEIQVSSQRLYQPTQLVAPGEPAQALQAANDLDRLLIDNARSGSNRLPFLTGADGVNELSASNPIRAGYTLETGFDGLMGFAFDAYRVRALTDPEFITSSNPRHEAPRRRSQLRIASFNVENLFTTLQGPGVGCGPNDLSCRGANTSSELERQLAKLVAAISAMDADIVALVEVENDANDSTLATLVSELNDANPYDNWHYLATGEMGTDAIKNAFVYRSRRVEPVGDYAVLDSSVDPDFDTSRQRPALAQSFATRNGGRFTAVNVHLRSKGSCPSDNGPDADSGDGQGCWNQWRTLSAAALARWLADNPTGAGTANHLILGDFNAYAQEDPLTTLYDAGYVNLAMAENEGESDYYSYTYFGQAGSLDYGLASPQC
ncbi:nuclease [Aliidiomarina sedimenti]|uniref:Nuclease n=1 Tax=Aliidiomarina sedimenti TaxID=1933879 RepID=A0ABY0BV42_9GAMM|nr:ExeM/NucH family extracellular endonuclease [Aliidiomarina sedimenti]RUO27881.1 nuclease [Aliidiomarina sedimenti]